MPVLGLVRSDRRRPRRRGARVLVTEHGGLGPHVGRLRPRPRRSSTPTPWRSAPAGSSSTPRRRSARSAAIYNNLTPTFSLGCGTWGGSTTTENVNYRQLLNIKTVSQRRTPPQWFRVPSTTFFNAGALDNLRDLDCDVVVVVTDALTDARGVVDDVRPSSPPGTCTSSPRSSRSPDEAVIRRGVALLDRTRPDTVIAVGGGSVLDAAKAMRLFHEHPEQSLDELTLPFLDPRKRMADFPQTPTRCGWSRSRPRPAPAPRCPRPPS